VSGARPSLKLGSGPNEGGYSATIPAVADDCPVRFGCARSAGFIRLGPTQFRPLTPHHYMRLRSILIAAVAAASAPLAASGQAADSVLAISRNGASLLRVNVDGNVGIGNPSPGQRLTVNGGVQADSISVQRVRFGDGTSLTTTGITTFTPSFGAGWASAATAGCSPAGNAETVYYKDVNGIVHIEGDVRRISGGAPLLMTLPVGYRPRGAMTFRITAPCSNSAGTAYVRIYASGEVYVAGWDGLNDLGLGGIHFIAAQ
jgi:hypothetical protein